MLDETASINIHKEEDNDWSCKKKWDIEWSAASKKHKKIPSVFKGQFMC